jgi:hypothetical protein
MQAVDAGGGDRRGVGGSDGRQRWTAPMPMASLRGRRRSGAGGDGGSGGEWRRWWRRREREAAAAATAPTAVVPEASASLLRALSAWPAPYVYVDVHEPRVHGV